MVPVTQLEWAIDPILGNDLNVGTLASPLKTGVAFTQRVGLNALWNQGVYNLYVLNDLLLPDFLFLPGFITRAGTIWGHGSATPGHGQSILLPSTTITARTTQNRVAGGGGTRGDITAGALNWSTGGVGATSLISTNAAPNKRIRLLDGAQPGAVGFAQVDAGVGKADVSQWTAQVVAGLTTPIVVATIAPAEIAIAGTEKFVVEKLTHVDLFYNGVQSLDENSVNTSGNSIGIESVDFKFLDSIAGAASLFTYGCSGVGVNTGPIYRGVIFLTACHTQGGIPNAPCAPSVYACHQTGTWSPRPGVLVTIDADTIAQGVPLFNALRGGALRIGTAASFGSTTDGFIVQSDGLCRSENIFIGSHLIWGSGATGAGANVNGGSTFGYVTTPPSILGAANQDFQVGGLTGAASIPVWDTTVNAWKTPVNNVAATWANLAGALANNAINPTNLAKLVKIV